MRNAQKEQDLLTVNEVLLPSRLGFFWLVYLWATIVIVGGTLLLGLYLPLRILGLLWPKAQKLAEEVVCRGISLLLIIQPWMKLKTIDLKLPDSAALLISNHRSTLDVFILLAKVRGIRIVAKSILFFIPFLNLMMLALKEIPISRGNIRSYWKAMRAVQEGVKRGDRIHVFPEMTRCPFGFSGVQDFHQAPFWMAFQEKIPLVLIAFLNTDRAWPKGYWRLSFRKPIEAKFLGVLDPRSFKSVTDLQQAAYHQLRESVLKSV